MSRRPNTKAIGGLKAKPRVPKPPPIPDVPGKKCPNCGQEYVHPVGNDYRTYPSYQDVPHENPFDCIRFLAKRIEEVESENQELRGDLRALGEDRC